MKEYNLGRVVGRGVPYGGAGGNILTKLGDEDYNTHWAEATPELVGAEAKRLQFTDTVVSGWTLGGGYGYYADIPLEGVTEGMTPMVMFSLMDATRGIFAPVSEAGDGFVRIHASEEPGEITIPTIICWEE